METCKLGVLFKGAFSSYFHLMEINVWSNCVSYLVQGCWGWAEEVILTIRLTTDWLQVAKLYWK